MSRIAIDCEDSEVRYKSCPDGSIVSSGTGLNSGSMSSKLWLKGFNMSLAFDFLVYNSYDSTCLCGVVVGLNEFMCVALRTVPGIYEALGKCQLFFLKQILCIMFHLCNT